MILHNVLLNHQRFIHFNTRPKKFDLMYLYKICLINDELFAYDQCILFVVFLYYYC